MKSLMNRFRNATKEAQEGFRRGQRMSNTIRDIAEGNIFYRNASFSDDVANQLEDQRRKSRNP